jgi:hypothetical protein
VHVFLFSVIIRKKSAAGMITRYAMRAPINIGARPLNTYNNFILK